MAVPLAVNNRGHIAVVVICDTGLSALCICNFIYPALAVILIDGIISERIRYR